MVVGKVMAAQRYLHPNHQACEYIYMVKEHHKCDLVEDIGIILGYLKVSHVIIRTLQRVREGDMTAIVEVRMTSLMALKMEEDSTRQRMQVYPRR